MLEKCNFVVEIRSMCDEETCSAGTDDGLIDISNGADVTKKTVKSSRICAKKKKRKLGLLTSGLLLFTFGISSLIWTPYELIMDERLNMRPGLPAFNWWKDPPDQIKMKVYIFNVTNSEKFLNGDDSKLQMEEIGPIVFSEKWIHENVTFNDNDTMTYRVITKAIYLPELNTIDLNATLVVPNIPVLIAASYMWDKPFYTKLGFNYLISSMGSKTIVERTVYNMLHENTDPILEIGSVFLPSLIPVANLGIVEMLYDNTPHTVNMYIGNHDHERFSLIEKYDGSINVPGHGDECKEKITNASEGTIFNQFLTKSSTLIYYRRSLCRLTPLYYKRELHKYGVLAYEFTFSNDSYDRTEPLEDDCHKGDPVLPDGLSDQSACFFSFPLAISFPHFLYGDPKLKTYVHGLKPNATLHGSYMYVDRLSGIPLESRGRTQCNIVMRPLKGLHKMFDNFSDIAVPLFWIEYGMDDLPYYIVYLMYFVNNVVPIGQRIMTAVCIISGTCLVWWTIRKFRRKIP